MATHRQAPEFRPWVEQVAGRIGDPVRRLRFLRAVAPVVQMAAGPRRSRTRSRFLAVVLFTAAGAAILWLARASALF
jgi:hypothetical protein